MTAEEILTNRFGAEVWNGFDEKAKQAYVDLLKEYAEQERKSAFAQALKYYGRDNVNHEGEYECSDKDVDWAYADFSTNNPLV